MCGTCGYQLKGLADRGLCPECGRPYTFETLSPLLSAPGALELVVRFGWPAVLLVMLWAAVGLSTPRDPYGPLVAMMYSVPILLAVFPFNSLFQVWRLSRRCIQPAHRSRLASRNADLLGTAAKITFYLTAIVPPLIVGGCVVIMCGGIR